MFEIKNFKASQKSSKPLKFFTLGSTKAYNCDKGQVLHSVVLAPHCGLLCDNVI